MPTPSFASLWARIDVTRKWILLSCAAVALSTFLPWYADIDAYGAGDLYLGVTGPLFLVGLLILASAVFTTAWIVLPLFGKRLPSLPMNEGSLFTFLAVQNLGLLLIANSVFFHPKFGVNITLKETGFGMILAFAGTLLMLWSSYRWRQRSARPLFTVEETPTTSRSSISTASSSLSGAAQRSAVPPRPDHHYSGTRPTIGTGLGQPLARRTPVERDSEEERPRPQPLRMDL